MAKKEIEPKIILEREYIIPLRKSWLKVPEYKRANKTVKAIKQFLVKHMKIYDRNLDKIKIDILLNNEIRFRGMRKPPAKIKVKARKYDNDIVRVELIEIPEHIKFARLREEKIKTIEKKKKEGEIKRKEEEKKVEEAKEEEKEPAEDEKEKEEKKEAVKEAGLKHAKVQAKQAKRLKEGGKMKQKTVHRMALQK